ncbi:MAG: hypothetical protein ACK5MN_01035 [Lachnospiraceae bacterium]
MGRQLNIEIIENGEALANCYFHWSAHSESAAVLTKSIIDAIPEVEASVKSSRVDVAVELFKRVGAVFADDELAYKSNALISVTKQEIEDTRRWQECAIYIYLDQKYFTFDLINCVSESEWKNLYFDGQNSSEHEENLEFLKFDLTHIPFESIDDFLAALNRHYESELHLKPEIADEYFWYM